MSVVFSILATLSSLYMLLCFVRIALTWFDRPVEGRPYELLTSAVDPYLDWFRRFSFLRTARLDFSPVAAMAVLALLSNVLGTIARFGHITIGILLSLILSAVWAAASFILIFLAIAVGLRLVVHLAGRGTSSPLWLALDSFVKPVLYRINRLIYRDRLVSYQQGMATTLAVLLVAWIGGGAIVGAVSGLLQKLPV